MIQSNLFLFIMICMTLLTNCQAENEIQKRIRFSNQIISKTSDEICKKYNATLMSMGGSTLDGIRSIDLSFIIDNSLTIDEARQLIVSCEEILLHNINSTSEARPYLVEYPFTASRAKVSISSKNYLPNSPDSISHITIARGIIFYDSRDEKSNYVEVYKEPYKQALQIVKLKHREIKNG